MIIAAVQYMLEDILMHHLQVLIAPSTWEMVSPCTAETSRNRKLNQEPGSHFDLHTKVFASLHVAEISQ